MAIGHTVNIKSGPGPYESGKEKPTNPASHKGDGAKSPVKPTIR